MEYDLRVESADFNDLVSGDTMKVSNASYATEAGGLDAKVVSELSKKYQIAIKEIDNGSLTDEEVSSAVFDQVFMPEIERLLIAGAFMKLNIMATVDDKPFEGEFAVTLDQDITQEDLSSGAVAPDVVLQKVDLAFKLSLSELFLADMEKISGYPAGSMAANSPYMVKNGDNFELIATAKKGVITLNGEESSLAEIIGKSMGMAAGSPASGMEDLSPEEQQELMQLLQQMKSE